jgi:hypothetical protein
MNPGTADRWLPFNYRDHRKEIQRQMDDRAAFVEEMKRKHPSPLKEKLAGKDVPDTSLST